MKYLGFVHLDVCGKVLVCLFGSHSFQFRQFLYQKSFVGILEDDSRFFLKVIDGEIFDVLAH